MGQSGTEFDISIQIILGILGMTLLTVFIVMFFVVYQRKLLHQKLDLQNLKSDYQKELLNAGILAQEKERTRIANELHDSIGGLLSATKLYVTNIDQDLSNDNFQLFKDKAILTISQNIDEVRTITMDLMPNSLERLGLVSAIRQLTQKLVDLKHIQVEFDIREEKRFGADREIILYRIIQELVNNTLKHSDASIVSIAMMYSEKLLQINYNENGNGFDLVAYEKRINSNGFGLKNMESRASYLEGTINFASENGNGFEASLTIPLKTSN